MIESVIALGLVAIAVWMRLAIGRAVLRGWRRRRPRRCAFVSAGRICIREPHPPGSNHVFQPRLKKLA
jgi:hypothetical protein